MPGNITHNMTFTRSLADDGEELGDIAADDSSTIDEHLGPLLLFQKPYRPALGCRMYHNVVNENHNLVSGSILCSTTLLTALSRQLMMQPSALIEQQLLYPTDLPNARQSQ
jgi:hypothetical protein